MLQIIFLKTPGIVFLAIVEYNTQKMCRKYQSPVNATKCQNKIVTCAKHNNNMQGLSRTNQLVAEDSVNC